MTIEELDTLRPGEKLLLRSNQIVVFDHLKWVHDPGTGHNRQLVKCVGCHLLSPSEIKCTFKTYLKGVTKRATTRS